MFLSRPLSSPGAFLTSLQTILFLPGCSSTNSVTHPSVGAVTATVGTPLTLTSRTSWGAYTDAMDA